MRGLHRGGWRAVPEGSKRWWDEAMNGLGNRIDRHVRKVRGVRAGLEPRGLRGFHYKDSKGRKSPSEGVESGKTGDQRLMLKAAIHRLIHRPVHNCLLMGENHPY